MSSGKLKSLKLQRTSQRNESATNVLAQDPSTLVVEEASARVETNEKSSEQRELLTPLHSTPKRSSERSNATQDHAVLGYRVNPILLPCTQEGVNEVAWDWESPLSKKAKRKCLNNVELAGTPKRASALQKKRSSNSPLLYKSIKRQLMKNDPQQESLEKFAAEMKALSEQIKVMPREAENSAARVDKEQTDDELLIQIDIDDFEGETKFEFTTNNENSTGDVVVLKTSLDDFFDDSIDDSMVKCSQEVEEKLKLVSSRGGKISSDSTNSSGAKKPSWHQQHYSRSLAARSDEAAGTSSKLGIGANSASSSKLGVGANSTSSSKLGMGSNSAGSSKLGIGANSASSSKLGIRSNSTSSSSSQRAAIATNETKRSTTLANTGSKFNAAPEKKTSSFSLKVPTKEAKASTFPVKFPTAEARRPNASATPSVPSRSSSFNNNAKETSKQSSAIVSSLDEVFEIPDDSFDDFLAVCFDDDDVQSTTEAASSRNESDRSSSRHGKTYEARNTTRAGSGNLRGSEASAARKLPLPPPQQPSSNSGSSNSLSRGISTVRRESASTCFPRSNSNDCLKPSARGASSAAAPPSQSTNAAAPPSQSANQARKFFKKSLSSSNFDDQGSSGAKGWKSNLFVNGKVSSVSTQEREIHRANDSRNNAWPSANGSEGNAGMYNVNRNGPRDDDNVRYKQANGSSRQGGRETAAGSQSAQICTPEEIERKRLEAKMKLEAKRKLLGRSTSSGALSGGTKRPIKR